MTEEATALEPLFAKQDSANQVSPVVLVVHMFWEAERLGFACTFALW